MRRVIGASLVVVVLLGFSSVAEARSIFGRPYQLYWENDIGIVSESSDKYYTNGLRLNIGTIDPPGWAKAIREKYCRKDEQCREKAGAFVSYSLGHNFYTPEVITVREPQPRDRPWAGYLYSAVSFQLTHPTGMAMHSVDGQFGVLGQGAGAQRAQVRWHEIINDRDTPMGWHNQLRNEPVLQLVYNFNHRFGGKSADLVVTGGGVLGTLMVAPTAGVTARLGRNISGFPVMPLQPTLFNAFDGGGDEREEREKRPCGDFNVFVGVDGRYVIHNAFLDGGFFRNGPGVGHHQRVYDVRAGISFRIISLRVTYNFIRRSEEFTPPPGRASGRHAVNSLFVAYEPW